MPDDHSSFTAAQRATWLSASDRELLAQCEFDRYRASGPGGQHRNKTESAVRVRHRPSGVQAIAEESRSQGENRERALRRLRESIMLEVRVALDPDAFVASAALTAMLARGTAPLGEKTRLLPAYLIAMAELLDLFAACDYQVAATGQRLGLTTGATSKFLLHDPAVVKAVAQWRSQRGLRPLH